VQEGKSGGGELEEDDKIKLFFFIPAVFREVFFFHGNEKFL